MIRYKVTEILTFPSSVNIFPLCSVTTVQTKFPLFIDKKNIMIRKQWRGQELVHKMTTIVCLLYLKKILLHMAICKSDFYYILLPHTFFSPFYSDDGY